MNEIQMSELVDNVENGIESPFIGLSKLRELKKTIEDCIKQIEPIAIDEATKYDKSFEIDGLKIEQRNGAKIFSFKKCESWVIYDKARKECEERLKLAYKSFENGLTSVTEDGEVLELPEVTYRKDSIIIKKIKS